MWFEFGQRRIRDLAIVSIVRAPNQAFKGINSLFKFLLLYIFSSLDGFYLNWKITFYSAIPLFWQVVLRMCYKWSQKIYIQSQILLGQKILSKITSHIHYILPLLKKQIFKFLTNSSDRFTNLEFRIYEIFWPIFVTISFLTVKLRKKNLFSTNNKFFLTAQTEKNLWKKWSRKLVEIRYEFRYCA